jgi:hypothetical protein
MVWMSFLISERVLGRPVRFGWDKFRQYRLNRSRCQHVTVSGRTNIKADFQSCQTMYRPIQNNRSRLLSFGRGTLRLNTTSWWRSAAFSNATCFCPARMRRMNRSETKMAFNMAKRVCKHRPEESTVWKSLRFWRTTGASYLGPAGVAGSKPIIVLHPFQ